MTIFPLAALALVAAPASAQFVVYGTGHATDGDSLMVGGVSAGDRKVAEADVAEAEQDWPKVF